MCQLASCVQFTALLPLPSTLFVPHSVGLLVSTLLTSCIKISLIYLEEVGFGTKNDQLDLGWE